MPLVWSPIKGKRVRLERTGTCQGVAGVLRDGVWMGLCGQGRDDAGF